LRLKKFFSKILKEFLKEIHTYTLLHLHLRISKKIFLKKPKNSRQNKTSLKGRRIEGTAPNSETTYMFKGRKKTKI